MRFHSVIRMVVLMMMVSLTVFGSTFAQDLNQQKQDLLRQIGELDKKLADNPSPQEYEDLMNQRKEIEQKIKDVTSKLMADAEAMKKINEVKRLYNEGNQCYKLGDYKCAVAAYDKAIAIDPTFFRAYYGKGLALWKLRDISGAMQAFQGAIDHNPTYAEAYLLLGKLHKGASQSDEAIKILSTGIENCPGAPKLYYERGAVYLDHKKDYNKAAEDFTKASRLDSEYGLAYFSLGVALTELGRLDEAMQALDSAKDSIGKKMLHEVHYRRAAILNKKSSYAEAKAAADLALKRKRDYAPAAYEAGKACKALGQFDQAITYFKILQKDRAWKRTGDYEIDLIINRDKYGN